MSQHLREVCVHGTVIRQCRCPGPATEKVVRPCPFEGQPGHESAGQTLVEEVGAADRRLTEELGSYIAGVNRYARDAHFHARVKRIEQLMKIAEPSMIDAASTGALWGIVTALHLVDTGVEGAQPPVGDMPGGGTVYGCPFKGCGWVLEVPSVDTFAGDFIENFGLFPSPRVFARLHHGAVDKAIREHLVEVHRSAIEALAGLL